MLARSRAAHMTRFTFARRAGLVAGPWALLACSAQRAQPLDQLPPVSLQVLMTTRNVQGASVTFNILTQDANKCFKLADSVQADINGHALSLLDAGGSLSTKGG